MKKIGSILLAMVMAAALMTGCGKAGSSSSAASGNENKTASSGENVTAQSQDNAQTPSGDGKTLVVYYSATGNTENVAKTIADITGGDLFEIEPKDAYTSDDLDWTDKNSRVSEEYADESLRNVELVSTTVDNWESYDTVYIGYPIWWGIAAWPVDSFVKANDFTGKTVIPFCTSSSSELGESGKLLSETAGTGDWQTGKRFRSSASESDVNSWIDSLGL